MKDERYLICKHSRHVDCHEKKKTNHFQDVYLFDWKIKPSEKPWQHLKNTHTIKTNLSASAWHSMCCNGCVKQEFTIFINIYHFLNEKWQQQKMVWPLCWSHKPPKTSHRTHFKCKSYAFKSTSSKNQMKVYWNQLLLNAYQIWLNQKHLNYHKY